MTASLSLQRVFPWAKEAPCGMRGGAGGSQLQQDSAHERHSLQTRMEARWVFQVWHILLVRSRILCLDCISAICFDYFSTWNVLIVYILVKNIIIGMYCQTSIKYNPTIIWTGAWWCVVVYRHCLYLQNWNEMWIHAKWKPKKGQMYFINKHVFPKPLAKVNAHQVASCLSVIEYSTPMVSLVPIKNSRSFHAKKYGISLLLKLKLSGK